MSLVVVFTPADSSLSLATFAVSVVIASETGSPLRSALLLLELLLVVVLLSSTQDTATTGSTEDIATGCFAFRVNALIPVLVSAMV
jgi:hypothetical protein